VAPPGPSFDALRLRAATLRGIRGFFDARGSLEVETPALVVSPGLDAFIEPVRARVCGEDLYLATSPEFAMKRLLARGAGRIHQIARVYRDGERGRLHEPEFTMLEWYVPGFDDRALIDETEALVRTLAAELSGAVLSSGSRQARTDEPFDRMSFRDAVREHSGIDVVRDDARRIGRALRAAGIRPPGDTSRDALIDLLLGAVVQPRLGFPRPCFVFDWPADRAALARLRDVGGEPVAARFELYACGVELCNGYDELLDAPEQEARMHGENVRRAARGAEPLPIDEAFLDALRTGLPACAGNALGVDRLVLLLFGGDDLSQVMTFRVAG
jgi:lysyl-tRNA synthetase class 2